jgi:excisionase family DNA binding protein
MPLPSPAVRSTDPFLSFDDLPPVVTTTEASSVLRVGVREVRALVESGQLPAARLGPRRVIRIRRDALIALLAGSTGRPARRTARPEVAFRPQTGGAVQGEE